MPPTDQTKKTIQINPQLFNLSAATNKAPKEKKKKEKPQMPVQHLKNTVKEKLLEQVKKHQLAKKGKEDLTKSFNDEFNSSLQFMAELEKKRNERQNRQTLKKRVHQQQQQQHINQHNNTNNINNNNGGIKVGGPVLKINPIYNTLTSSLPTLAAASPTLSATETLPLLVNNSPLIKAPSTPSALTVVTTPFAKQAEPFDPINLDVNDSSDIEDIDQINVKPWIPKAPTYSNLKGGLGKTFRQTFKAGMNSPTLMVAPSASASKSTHENVNAFKKALAKKVLKQPHVKKRINRTLKYKLGKHGKKMSVFIRNNTTRKLVQMERDLLKSKSILEIKNYLRSKNFLKAGSLVPNDVLRQMYENIILAGDVSNKNGSVLLHNYFKDGLTESTTGTYKF